MTGEPTNNVGPFLVRLLCHVHLHENDVGASARVIPIPKIVFMSVAWRGGLGGAVSRRFPNAACLFLFHCQLVSTVSNSPMLDLWTVTFEFLNKVTDSLLIVLIVIVASVEDQVRLHLLPLHHQVVRQVEIEQVLVVRGGFAENLRSTEEVWKPLMLPPLHVV